MYYTISATPRRCPKWPIDIHIVGKYRLPNEGTGDATLVCSYCSLANKTAKEVEHFIKREHEGIFCDGNQSENVPCTLLKLHPEKKRYPYL